jgi:hypothetical protein
MSTSWPNSIKVTGLPFMLQGWNNVYYRIPSKLIEDAPVYRLEAYTLYYVFPIIAVEIYKTKKGWALARDCDCYPSFLKEDSNLFGKWYDNNFDLTFNVVINDKKWLSSSITMDD